MITSEEFGVRLDRTLWASEDSDKTTRELIIELISDLIGEDDDMNLKTTEESLVAGARNYLRAELRKIAGIGK